MSAHYTLHPGDSQVLGTNLIGSTTLFAQCSASGDSVLTYRLEGANQPTNRVDLNAGQPWSTTLDAVALLLKVVNDGFSDIEIWTDA